MENEKELYPVVEEFLTKEFGCCKTTTDAGPEYGKIDVLGIREYGSYFASRVEVVAVEVKRSRSRFLNSIGQALSYSLYAHRVYLAWRDSEGITMSDDRINIANYFGVGILSVSSRNRVRIISTSHEFKPERHYLLQTINSLEYFECTICQSYYPKEGTSNINKNKAINISDDPDYRGRFKDAVKSGKPARYWLYQQGENRGYETEYLYNSRFICKDCCSISSSLLPQ